MSNQPIDHPGGRILAWLILLIGVFLNPQTVSGQDTATDASRPYPLIVRARPGDTPATLARRYLKDASRAWMIEEYNPTATIAPDDAVLIPLSPFRPGGLTPDGFQAVPVLVYTDLDHDSPTAAAAFAATFNQQMQWLKSSGFTAVSPSQLLAFLNFSGQLPRRSVLITADTESRSFYDRMAPVLKELGFTATVFVATGRVGDRGAMTWTELKQLRQDGFAIGCRAKNGRSLARRKRGQSFEANFRWIEAELEQARAEIEANLNEPCLLLAYPQGGTNGLISAMAARIGFSAAFTRFPGKNPFYTDRFRIHRTVVDARTGLNQFAEELATMIEADLK